MTAFRFIHTADLHLGKQFGNMPEEIRGRLREARHTVVGRIAERARAHAAPCVLVAGDIFDTETPSPQVWRQALAVMAAADDLTWVLLPGNHDSLAAEALWDNVLREAAPNIRVVLEAAPLTLTEGVILLPAPVTRRFVVGDPTDWMTGAPTPEGAIRLGLAHGKVLDFGDDDGGRDVIAPDRARLSGLDYLALGDWHGQRSIGDRTWYSGTPERDAFKHSGRGACLAVTLTAGAPVQAEAMETGEFHWSIDDLPLLAQDDAVAALTAMLPAQATRRQSLIRVRAIGRTGMAQRAALERAVAAAAPDYARLTLDQDQLATEYEQAALDEIDQAGALRVAADGLWQAAEDPTRPMLDREIAAAALLRLYGYVKDDRA